MIDVRRRAFFHEGATVPEQTLHVDIRSARIAKLEDSERHALGVAIFRSSRC